MPQFPIAQSLRKIILVLPLAFSGCTYTTRMDVPEGVPSSTILAGHYHESLSHARWFAIESVDGKPVLNQTGDRDEFDRMYVEVMPGEHQFVIRARVTTPVICVATIQLKTTVEAGQKYRVNGAAKDGEYRVWLENAQTHAKTSAEASGKFEMLRTTFSDSLIFGAALAPAFTPIFH